jgi:hypothetical protein
MVNERKAAGTESFDGNVGNAKRLSALSVILEARARDLYLPYRGVLAHDADRGERELLDFLNSNRQFHKVKMRYVQGLVAVFNPAKEDVKGLPAPLQAFIARVHEAKVGGDVCQRADPVEFVAEASKRAQKEMRNHIEKLTVRHREVSLWCARVLSVLNVAWQVMNRCVRDRATFKELKLNWERLTDSVTTLKIMLELNKLRRILRMRARQLQEADDMLVRSRAATGRSCVVASRADAARGPGQAASAPPAPQGRNGQAQRGGALRGVPGPAHRARRQAALPPAPALDAEGAEDADIKAATSRVNGADTNVRQKQRKLAFCASNFVGPSVETGDCSICRCELGKKPVALTICGHRFCYECVTSWLDLHTTCPFCRGPLLRENVFRISKNDQWNCLRHLRAFSSTRRAVPDGTETTPLVECSGLATQLDSVGVKSSGGEAGSKVEVLVRYVLHVLREDKEARVLVFSHFLRMLNILDKALLENGTASLLLTGGPKERAKIIESFQGDGNASSPRVLLLSMLTDCSGLTLVSANHVFLCEPSISPALEAQATNRIHRIGQQRPCFVHKFIMKDSIEERIERALGALTAPAAPAGGAAPADATSEEFVSMAMTEDTQTARAVRKENLRVEDLLKFLDIHQSGGASDADSDDRAAAAATE